VIGVISKADQKAVVEEFFELFKTPWEFYRPGRKYDVVLSTTDDESQVDAKVVISFGATPKRSDFLSGIITRQQSKDGSLKYHDVAIPIYTQLSILESTDEDIALISVAEGVVGIRQQSARGSVLIRLGYDLFEEVRFLLCVGQPVEYAAVPTLDFHIEMLRNWILEAGIPLVEIPPTPSDHQFIVCLTHDIDFIGIRNHRFDQTMWGFLYRSTVGAVRNLVRGRLSFQQLLKTWRAAISLPFVYLGWLTDFWSPFEWYLELERGLAATYFLIPFKGRAGEQVPGRNASRRAAAYDVGDIPDWAAILKERGNEIGVHGIDAWHSVEKGQAELRRIEQVAGETVNGIRMHWLLHNEKSCSVLEKAGYRYDATAGYNETVGYKNGTTQVFRPLNVQNLLELPTHIQDGALFYPNRLDLSEADARQRCHALINSSNRLGGVLTLIWHDRSHGPERFWGDFYVQLVQSLKSLGIWFATASQAVSWFRERRAVRFEQAATGECVRINLVHAQRVNSPPFRLRVHQPMRDRNATELADKKTLPFVDTPWNGQGTIEYNSSSNKMVVWHNKLTVRERDRDADCLHSSPKRL
jgi:hypothetical protein